MATDSVGPAAAPPIDQLNLPPPLPPGPTNEAAKHLGSDTIAKSAPRNQVTGPSSLLAAAHAAHGSNDASAAVAGSVAARSAPQSLAQGARDAADSAAQAVRAAAPRVLSAAAELAPPVAMGSFAAGAAIAATGGGAPVSREARASQIAQEQQQFAGDPSHIWSPYANPSLPHSAVAGYLASLPTQAQLDAKVAPHPQPGASPASTLPISHTGSGVVGSISPNAPQSSVGLSVFPAAAPALSSTSVSPAGAPKSIGLTTTPNQGNRPASETMDAKNVHDIASDFPGWSIQQGTFTKPTKADLEAAQKAAGPAKAQYVKDYAKQNESALRARFGDAAVDRMLKDGKAPTGYQVHHIVPLAMGGTNAQDNLVLLQDNPQHRAITGAQKTLTAGMQPGDTRSFDWLYPPKGTGIFP